MLDERLLRWRKNDVCCSEEVKKRLAAPLAGEQLRDLGAALAPGWARELSSLFQDGRPEGLLWLFSIAGSS